MYDGEEVSMMTKSFIFDKPRKENFTRVTVDWFLTWLESVIEFKESTKVGVFIRNKMSQFEMMA